MRGAWQQLLAKVSVGVLAVLLGLSSLPHHHEPGAHASVTSHCALCAGHRTAPAVEPLGGHPTPALHVVARFEPTPIDASRRARYDVPPGRAPPVLLGSVIA